ncbi:MAG: hypothetical protein U1E36_01170 [Rickettsiales bacterium]
MSFEKAFNDLPADAQHKVQEIAAFAVLQAHLKDPATDPSLENVAMVSNALAIMYDGNTSRIDVEFQGVMSSRRAQEEMSKANAVGI